jgi:hypothetical protein
MCSKAVLLAAVLALVLGAGQTVTRAFAVEHGGGVVTGSHFGYGSFGHYSGDWSDSDYDEAPTYGNNAVYPPPASAVAPAAEPSCHRTSETFNVPSAEGGTREITVIGCP